MNFDFVLREFISIWVVVDPIGTIPVFIGVTAGLSAASQRVIGNADASIISRVMGLILASVAVDNIL
jgi:multiple antibiotic resistance protein